MLLAALVQRTGDPRWLDARYQDACRDGAGACEARAELNQIHDAVLELVNNDGTGGVAAKDRGPLSHEVLLELLTLVCGDEIGAKYLPKLIEDTGISPRRTWVPDVEKRPNFHVLVIGSGPAGLHMAAALRRAGVSFQVLEKNLGIGGVWHDNIYPGCGVDTPNHLYSFAEFMNPGWSRCYPLREEIIGYFGSYAHARDVIDSIVFGAEVRQMSFDADTSRWVLDVLRSDGTPVTFTGDAVITATGILNRPKIPDIEGIESFRGDHFHTAEWNDDVDLSGNVGLIGNGSSGVQVGRFLAARARKLTAFQRSPHWIEPKRDYHAPVSANERWLCRVLPEYAAWRRFQLYWRLGDALFKYFRIDAEWEGEGVNPCNAQLRAELVAYIRSQVGERDDLFDKLVPDYPPFTKRMVIDNQWYKTLTRTNVELVTEPIVRATAQGVLTADGREHELDVILYATGFNNSRYLYPIEVSGLGGVTFDDVFGADDNVRAYLGITVPGFPNMFSVMGPNSAIVGGSSLYTIECQVNYIMGCLTRMIDDGIVTMECRKDTCDAYNARLDEQTQGLVWSLPEAGLRYLNRAGRVVINHPWELQDYWLWTRDPKLEDFLIRRTPAAEALG